MRVLVLATEVADLSSQAVGAEVARAWARRGHQVAVVSLTDSVERLQAAVDGLPDTSALVVRGDSGAALAAAATAAVGGGARTVLLDLTALPALSGAGDLLEGFGATADASLAGGPATFGSITSVTLPDFGARLVGVVAAEDAAAELVGIRGAAARDGFDKGTDRSDVLANDAALASLAAVLSVDPATPGAGAAGGAGLAVAALGGVIRTPLDAVADLAGLEASVALADLLVLVLPALDFGGSGVPLAQAAARWASGAGIACVVIAGVVQISGRELRTLGVESAYGLTGTTLPEMAARVAATWSW